LDLVDSTWFCHILKNHSELQAHYGHATIIRCQDSF
jgi:hypothetical protein